MSRMPPSLSGGLLCASAAPAPSASSAASAPVSIRLIRSSLSDGRIACGPCLFCVSRDHAAGLHQRQAEATCSDATASARAMHFPQNGMADQTSGERLSQQPLAGYVVELEPDAVGILEQQRIVAGRPAVLARGADDPGVQREQEGVQFIDVRTLARPKAQMMQADALLLEGCAGMFRRGCADADRGAAADAIEGGVGIDDGRHAEKWQELAIERARALEIRRGEKNMRDAVDLHRLPPASINFSTNGHL